MKFSNTWFIISIMVMSVSVFYLVVHTLLVVERSNRAVEQPAKLRDILTEDELSHLQSLVDDRKITIDWIQHIFVPRLTEELEHLDWIKQRWDIDLDDPKYASHREVYASEREKALAKVQERRRTLFDRALNQNVFQRTTGTRNRTSHTFDRRNRGWVEVVFERGEPYRCCTGCREKYCYFYSTWYRYYRKNI